MSYSQFFSQQFMVMFLLTSLYPYLQYYLPIIRNCPLPSPFSIKIRIRNFLICINSPNFIECCISIRWNHILLNNVSIFYTDIIIFLLRNVGFVSINHFLNYTLQFITLTEFFSYIKFTTSPSPFFFIIFSLGIICPHTNLHQFVLKPTDYYFPIFFLSL